MVHKLLVSNYLWISMYHNYYASISVLTLSNWVKAKIS